MRSKEVEKAIIKLTTAQKDIWYATLYSQEEQDEDIKTVLNYISELEEEKRHRKYLLHNKKFYSAEYMTEIICCEDIKDLLEGE